MAIDFNSAPQLKIPTTRQERKDLGIGEYYVDSYIEGQTAQYNNQYNAWLLNQQLEYNSPKNQVERLKEAGLNPNFNSIDGTGNMSPVNATSNASIKPNVVQNTNQAIATYVQAANTMLGLFSDGVRKFSDITGGTMDLPGYIQYLKSVNNSNKASAGYNAVNRAIDMVYNAWLKGGSSNAIGTSDGSIIPLDTIDLYDRNGNTAVLPLNPGESMQGILLNALNELRGKQGTSLDKENALKDLRKTIMGLDQSGKETSNQLQQKELDMYELNKFAGPVIQFLKLIFGK